MSELNENVEVTIDDATVVTVPLVENFTATNAAPTAKYVGDALDEKVDVDGIMEAVRITFNGIQSDNQGIIIASSDDIPVEDGGTATIREALVELDAKTANDISYTVGQTIKEKVDGIDAKTAGQISYVTGGQTIKEKVDEVAAVAANAILKTEQSLLPAEQAQVKANIGVAAAAGYAVANNLTTESSGGAVLDAAQGYALNNALNNFKNRFNAQNLTSSVTIDNVDSGSQASIVQDSLSVIRIGQMCRIKFNLKFASTQSSTCLALKCNLHNIPLPFAGGARGVSATAGTTTTSIFTYYLQANGTLDIRFIHTGRDGSSSAEYINVIEYMIDDYSGGDDGGEE